MACSSLHSCCSSLPDSLCMTRVSWENVNRDQHNAALVNRDQCNAALDFGVACTDPVTQIRKETSNDKMMMTKSAFFLLSVIGNRNLKKVVDKCCGSPVFVPGPLHDLDLECDDEIPPAANDCLGACGKSIAYDCAFFDATPDTESCSDTVYRFYTGANEVRLKDGTFTCEEYNEVEQRITVTDTTPPVMTTPDDVTIECTEDVPVPDLNTVSAIDNCQSNVFITHEGDVADRNGQACPRTITRTFRATDGCGNYVEDTQTITVLERA